MNRILGDATHRKTTEWGRIMFTMKMFIRLRATTSDPNEPYRLLIMENDQQCYILSIVTSHQDGARLSFQDREL